MKLIILAFWWYHVATYDTMAKCHSEGQRILSDYENVTEYECCNQDYCEVKEKPLERGLSDLTREGG